MRIRQREKRRVRIEIIPMIDVIFFLLVFFMVSSLAMTKLNSVPVSLPKTAASPQALKQDVILTVKKDGALFVNKSPVTDETLGAVLALAMKGREEEAVVVNADRGVPYGSVVTAMDGARRIGVRKFALATEPMSK